METGNENISVVSKGVVEVVVVVDSAALARRMLMYSRYDSYRAGLGGVDDRVEICFLSKL